MKIYTLEEIIGAVFQYKDEKKTVYRVERSRRKNSDFDLVCYNTATRHDHPAWKIDFFNQKVQERTWNILILPVLNYEIY